MLHVLYPNWMSNTIMTFLRRMMDVMLDVMMDVLMDVMMDVMMHAMMDVIRPQQDIEETPQDVEVSQTFLMRQIVSVSSISLSALDRNFAC